MILANGVPKAFSKKVLTNFGPYAKTQNGNRSLKKVDGGFFDIMTDVGSVWITLDRGKFFHIFSKFSKWMKLTIQPWMYRYNT